MVDINGKWWIMSNVVQYSWSNLDIHVQRHSHFCDDFLKFPYPIYSRMTNILGIITIHYAFERLWILKVVVLTNSLKDVILTYSLERNGSYPPKTRQILHDAMFNSGPSWWTARVGFLRLLSRLAPPSPWTFRRSPAAPGWAPAPAPRGRRARTTWCRWARGSRRRPRCRRWICHICRGGDWWRCNRDLEQIFS